MADAMRVIDLGALGDGGVEIDGVRDGVTGGGRISSLGDVDGDGLADFAVTSGFFNRSNPNYDMIFFGQGALTPTLGPSDLDGQHGFLVRTSQPAMAAGDVNGDGLDDLLLRTYTNFHRSGAILYGDGDHTETEMAVPTANGPDGLVLTFDEHVAVGDVNGDGFDDVLSDVRAYDFYSGEARLVLGGPTGTDTSFTFAHSKDSYIDGAAASLGDINGDGFDDFGIRGGLGYPYHNTMYVVFGRASMGPMDLDLMTPDQGFVEEETAKKAGDINGDGFDDFIIRHSVVFGHAGPWSDVAAAAVDGSNGFMIVGRTSNYDPIEAAGDFNGDGFDDLLCGDYKDSSHGDRAGAVYIVYGHAGGFDAAVDVNTLTSETGLKIVGALPGNEIGFLMTALGDVNGDGVDDIGISDPNHLAADTGLDSGAAYVVYGLLPEDAVNRTGGAGDDHLVGGGLNDRLSGLKGADALYGNGGRDLLAGGTGDDVLRAGDGKDKLIGGDGADTLVGGEGKDKLFGGTGGDVFRYESAAQSSTTSRDLISDLGVGDIIDLRLIDADVNTEGDQAFSLVSKFGRHAGDLVLTYDNHSHITLLQGDLDGNGKADFAIQIQGQHLDFTGFVL